MKRLIFVSLLLWPICARAEDKAAPAAEAGQRPNVRTYLRVTVVDDPSKAPPLPTSRPQGEASRRDNPRPAAERGKPGEQPGEQAPRAVDPTDRPAAGVERPAREGLRREEARERLRDELRDARRERAAERRDAPERPRETLRERVRERVRENGRQRDNN